MNLHKLIPLAWETSKLSKDPRTKVGCLVVDDRGAIRASGYNGFPRGVDDSPERYADRALKQKLVAHSEANAIANAAAVGTPLINCSMIVTKFPCQECAKLIINAGIKHVYTTQMEDDSYWKESNIVALSMFLEAGVSVEVWK